jgi:hypothetical protein
MGGLSYAHATIFTWLDHLLCGAEAPATKCADGRQQLVDAFGRFGGKQAARKAASLPAAVHLI